MKNDALTDDEILSICQHELQQAAGYAAGDLAAERADAMERYLGEPDGHEIDGRSQVVTREVLETVESILPSLIRLFCDSDNMVVFEATGPEDEAQAKLETDTVNYVYWQQNKGFINTYTVIKDALLSKTGILKVWADTSEDEEREEYEGIDDVQLAQLMDEPGVEREIIEYEMTEAGHSVTFKTTKKSCKICIEPTPPEEFGVEQDARSPFIKDSNFCYHRAKKTKGELIAEGYSEDLIDSLPYDDDVDTQERLSRRHLSDEWESLDYSSSPSMRTIWVTECYLRLDRDGDGINELVKATIAAGAWQASNAVLLDVEEVDRIPFCTATPIILTHKFYGLSVADLVTDLQEISTTLHRQILDNTYLANNGRTAVNTDRVNIDDVLTSRPGNVVRFDGEGSWSQYIGPIPHNPLPTETYGLLERLDDMRQGRTGSGDEVAGLDKASLANVNTGVAALAYDMARMKIELIARIIAETCFRPLFRDIHELLLKNQDMPIAIKTQGQWQQINPSEWRTRENTRVMVGVGQVSRERRMMALDAIMAKQQELIAAGGMGTLLMPWHQYQSYADWISTWGLEPSLYVQDPRQLPPPQPKQPGAQEMLMQAQAQALQADSQIKMQKNQLEAAKMQMEMRAKERDWQYQERENQMKMQVEGMKARLAQLKTETEVQGKIQSMELEREKKDLDMSISSLHEQLQHIKAERDREVDVYKIQMDALSKQLQMHGITSDPEEEAEKQRQTEAKEQMKEAQTAQFWGELMASVQTLSEKLAEMDAAQKAPREIVRDANGLMISIGGKPVKRDKAGQAVSIG